MNADLKRDTEFQLDGIVPWGRRYEEYAAFSR